MVRIEERGEGVEGGARKRSPVSRKLIGQTAVASGFAASRLDKRLSVPMLPNIEWIRQTECFCAAWSVTKADRPVPEGIEFHTRDFLCYRVNAGINRSREGGGVGEAR